MITIPVTAYVHQFLRHRYGPGPYILAHKSKSRLVSIFEDVPADARKFPSGRATHRISVDITQSLPLQRIYEAHIPYYQIGVFGMRAFWDHVVGFVEGHVASTGGTYRQALTEIITRMNICEDDYSFENLERQHRRHRSRQLTQLQQRSGYSRTYPAALVKKYLACCTHRKPVASQATLLF